MGLPRLALLRLATATLVVACAAACSQGATHEQAAPVAAEPSATARSGESAPVVAHDDLAGWADVDKRSLGDVARGKVLVAKYECNRCHAGTGQPAEPFLRQCVGCHQVIAAETLPFPREKLEAWRNATRHYITTPSLATIGRTLRPSWIASFLREPVKIRPHLEEWMPRLRISESDARDFAAFLTAGAEAPHASPLGGDAVRGKEIVSRKGCFVCHELRGASRTDVAAELPAIAGEKLARVIVQAPDLRLARERFRPDVLVRWIVDPTRVRADADMPVLGLTEQEARDAAAYLLSTPLAAPPPAEPPIKRLPLLDRRVSYEEVATRVFRRSCTHCHADPGPSGDPGPGARAASVSPLAACSCCRSTGRSSATSPTEEADAASSRASRRSSPGEAPASWPRWWRVTRRRPGDRWPRCAACPWGSRACRRRRFSSSRRGRRRGGRSSDSRRFPLSVWRV